MWAVEVTDEFTAWWLTLNEDEQASVTAGVQLLEEHGPSLGRSHADTLRGSRLPT